MATIWDAPVTAPGAVNDVGIRFRGEISGGYIEDGRRLVLFWRGPTYPPVLGEDVYFRQVRIQDTVEPSFAGSGPAPVLRLDFAADPARARIGIGHDLSPTAEATWRVALRDAGDAASTWGPYALKSDLGGTDPYALPIELADYNAIMARARSYGARLRSATWTVVLFDRPARDVTSDGRLVDVPSHPSGPDVRLAGVRLAGRELLTGTLSVEQRINQRTTCEFQSFWPLTAGGSHLLLEDGGRMALEDGTGFLALESFRRRLPRFGDALSVDLPHTSFRQRVLDRQPFVYWALDERPGRTQVRDWSGHDRHGTVGTGVALRDRQGHEAAVPYGGAPRMHTGKISLSGFTLPYVSTIQAWIDLGAWNTPEVVEMIGLEPGRNQLPYIAQRGGQLYVVGFDGRANRYDDLGAGWHLITLVLDGANGNKLFVDGRRVRSWTSGADTSRAAKLKIVAGPWWIDEFSITPYALTDEVVAGDHAARAHLRVFDGAVLDPSVRGREHSGEAEVRVNGAGQGMLLERAAVTRPVVTDPALAVGDVMDGLLKAHAPESGLTTDGVRIPALEVRQVYALQTLHEVFRHLAAAGTGDLWVAPWGEIQAVPRAGVPAAGVRFDGASCAESESMDDSQHLRTTQVLVGAAGARGETVEWFAGDGSRTAFGPLRYPPDTVIDIQVDGVSEPWTGAAPTWTVSTDDLIATRNAAPPAPGTSPPGPRDGIPDSPGQAGTNVMVRYRSGFPIVAEVTSDEARGLYGRWVRIDEDRTADDAPLVRARAQTRLDRHDTPARRLTVSTASGALGPIAPGVLARCHFPRLHGIDELDMLVDAVRTRVGSGAGGLQHDVELVAGDYQSRFLDYLREIGKVTTPFRLAAGQRAASPTRHTTGPIDAGFEGVVLPVALGGSASAPNTTRDAWTPIAGGVIARLNGRSLASLQGTMVLTFNARVDPPASGTWSAGVQLYNRTAATPVGSALRVTSPTQAIHHVPRLELAQGTAEYEVRYRIEYSGSERRRPALWVTAATLTAGGATGG